jgi:hypothetical protein
MCDVHPMTSRWIGNVLASWCCFQLLQVFWGVKVTPLDLSIEEQLRDCVAEAYLDTMDHLLKIGVTSMGLHLRIFKRLYVEEGGIAHQ